MAYNIRPVTRFGKVWYEARDSTGNKVAKASTSPATAYLRAVAADSRKAV